MSKDHYTAVIEINSVTFTSKSGGYNQPSIEIRDVNEITRIVLRADTLESIKEKIARHVEIV